MVERVNDAYVGITSLAVIAMIVLLSWSEILRWLDSTWLGQIV